MTFGSLHRSAGHPGALLAVALLITACGGGGGSNGSADAGPSYTLDFTQFGVDSTSLVVAAQGQPDTAFKFSWQATRAGGLPNYSFDVHLVPAATPNAARNDDNAALRTGCGPGNFPCDATGEAACTYTDSGSATRPRQTQCSGGTLRRLELAPGSYVAVARACYITAAPLVQEVCSERSANLTLN